MAVNPDSVKQLARVVNTMKDSIVNIQYIITTLYRVLNNEQINETAYNFINFSGFNA